MGGFVLEGYVTFVGLEEGSPVLQQGMYAAVSIRNASTLLASTSMVLFFLVRGGL